LIITALSDLHGYLPEIEPCDLLLISGDICPHMYGSKSIRYDKEVDAACQYNWLDTVFRQWLEKIPAKQTLITWGNHDFVGEGMLLPMYLLDVLLVDEQKIVQNGDYGQLKVWGTPWSKEFNGWAFGLSEEKMALALAQMPDDTDILIVHGPPYQVGDHVPGHGPQGSKALRDRIEQVYPKLVVCGHIHEGYGLRRLGASAIMNASLMNAVYKPTNPVQRFRLTSGNLLIPLTVDG
jgi:Icc-related predicted phosphoesterase